MLELYTAIWRVSGRRQIFLILLSISVAALAAVPLQFQKDITNGLTDVSIDETYLFMLCAGMFGAILLSLALKWLMGLKTSLLGEDVIRMIRNRVYTNAVGPDDEGEDKSIGTLTTMVSAEAEEVGRFAGNAFSDPVVQIGTLISVVGFIMATQPGLGLIALCMIVPQVVVVLSTQGKINALVASRIRILRHSTDCISSADLKKIDEEITVLFDEIYETRHRLFLWKLSTKFVLSAVSGLGTVAVLALGGSLVLADQTDVGTVVAAIIGLGRLQGPTSYLIAFYRQVSSTRVKFELLRDATRPAAA